MYFYLARDWPTNSCLLDFARYQFIGIVYTKKAEKQVSREPKIPSFFQIYPGANDTSILRPYKHPPLTKTPTKTNQKQGKTKRKIKRKKGSQPKFRGSLITHPRFLYQSLRNELLV